MLTKTSHRITNDMLLRAVNDIPNIDFKLTINQPTGNFFYDKWTIKDEFRDTVWEEILNSLPYNQGEARLIMLDTNSCYSCHGDIDDRWHLSIISDKSYIIDLCTDIMYKQVDDCYWYDMNAGPVHSAVNFNNRPRIQLVVRKLLKYNTLSNPVSIEIRPNIERTDLRFQFDQTISPWLNKANKNGTITNFMNFDSYCKFEIEKNSLDELLSISPEYFDINVK